MKRPSLQTEFSASDGVGRIFLCRPHRMNALTVQMTTEIVAALEECEKNDAVASIIFSGVGGNFCSGGDLKELGAADDSIQAYMRSMLEFFARVEDCKKPTIACVDGHCLGGGLELALACDLIVASESAKFGLPETRFGMVPGFAMQRLPALIGALRAAGLLFAKPIINATEAYRLGLIYNVAKAEDLKERVDEITDHIAKLAPLAVAAEKDVLRRHRRTKGDIDHSVSINVALYRSARAERDLLGLRNRTRDEKATTKIAR